MKNIIYGFIFTALLGLTLWLVELRVQAAEIRIEGETLLYAEDDHDMGPVSGAAGIYYAVDISNQAGCAVTLSLEEAGALTGDELAGDITLSVYEGNDPLIEKVPLREAAFSLLVPEGGSLELSYHYILSDEGASAGGTFEAELLFTVKATDAAAGDAEGGESGEDDSQGSDITKGDPANDDITGGNSGSDDSSPSESNDDRSNSSGSQAEDDGSGGSASQAIDDGSASSGSSYSGASGGSVSFRGSAYNKDLHLYENPAADSPIASAGSWIYLDDAWYFMGVSSYAQGGWALIDGHWYHFSDDGAMSHGWYRADETDWYYLSEDEASFGAMVTGWHEDTTDGYTYFLDPDSGLMQSGMQEIDGIFYRFETYEETKSTHYFPDGLGGWYYTDDGEKTYGSLYMGEFTPEGYYATVTGLVVAV